MNPVSFFEGCSPFQDDDTGFVSFRSHPIYPMHPGGLDRWSGLARAHRSKLPGHYRSSQSITFWPSAKKDLESSSEPLCNQGWLRTLHSKMIRYVEWRANVAKAEERQPISEQFAPTDFKRLSGAALWGIIFRHHACQQMRLNRFRVDKTPLTTSTTFT